MGDDYQQPWHTEGYKKLSRIMWYAAVQEKLRVWDLPHTVEVVQILVGAGRKIREEKKLV